MKKLLAVILVLATICALCAMPVSAANVADPMSMKLAEAVDHCDMFYERVYWYVICQVNRKFVEWDYSSEEPPIVPVPAAEYEAEAAKYCVLSDELLAEIRSYESYGGEIFYDPETNVYNAFFIGGWGGTLRSRYYAGYIKTGADTYDVYYEDVTYEYLDEVLPEGMTTADIVGEEWPATIEYGGHIYRDGMDGYYRVKSYNKHGVKYGVQIVDGKALLTGSTRYDVGEQPEEFDDMTIEDLLTYEIVDGEAVITDCDDTVTGNITIPDQLGGYPVTTIGSSAFGGCDELTGVTLPESLTTIEMSAFFMTNLSEITIPASVTYIDNGAFYGAQGLSAIWVDEDNQTYSSDSCGILFDKAKTTLLRMPGNFYGSYSIPSSVTTIGGSSCAETCVTEIIIPDSVTTIEYAAFRQCWYLTQIYIPASVTNIEGDMTYMCQDLTQIQVAEENPNYSSDAYGVLYNKDKTQMLEAPRALAGSYIVPDSITELPAGILFGCNQMTDIHIPTSVKSIGEGAFFFCDSLTGVYYAGSKTEWEQITIGQDNECLTSAYIHFARIDPAKITSQPKTAKVKAGSTAKFTVKATGEGLKYQWQSSANGKSWKDCTSSTAKKATFSFTAKTSHSSNYYRCKITDAAGNTVYTDAARLYVLGITSQPKTQKVEAGEKVKFTVTATGAGKTYQWQSSTDGKTWKNCSSSSATSATFSFTSKTSHSGNYYRCRIKDSGGNTVYTDAVRLYVLGITEQPVSKTVTKGKTAKFTVEATGASKVYQWQVSTDGGKTWKNCSSSSATKATFTFTSKTTHNGNYYRCRIKDSGGNTVYTAKVKLTVKK